MSTGSPTIVSLRDALGAAFDIVESGLAGFAQAES